MHWERGSEHRKRAFQVSGRVPEHREQVSGHREREFRVSGWVTERWGGLPSLWTSGDGVFV